MACVALSCCVRHVRQHAQAEVSKVCTFKALPQALIYVVNAAHRYVFEEMLYLRRIEMRDLRCSEINLRGRRKSLAQPGHVPGLGPLASDWCKLTAVWCFKMFCNALL